MHSLSRREWIALLGSSVCALAQRFANLELFTVRVNHRGNWVFVRITTSEGVTGIGEASHGSSDDVVKALVAKWFDVIRTRTLWDLEQIRQDLWPEVRKAGRNGAVAFGAIEQCCWDLRGKVLNKPVYELLGGKLRDQIRNYANINRASEVREPEAFGELAKRAVAAGFTAIKLAPFDGMPKDDPARIKSHTDRGIACVAEVRKAAGEKAEILVDGHSNFDLENSLAVMRRLEQYRLFWLEEMSRKPQDLAKIRKAATMTTAGGESLFGVDGFYDYIQSGAVDVVMPDVKYCGGLWEMKKISAIAEAAKIKVSPHGPASPVGNLAAAHASLTMPNFLILEMAFGEVPWRGEIIRPAEQVLPGGFLLPSTRPGFGIELNQDAVRAHSIS